MVDIGARLGEAGMVCLGVESDGAPMLDPHGEADWHVVDATASLALPGPVRICPFDIKGACASSSDEWLAAERLRAKVAVCLRLTLG